MGELARSEDCGMIIVLRHAAVDPVLVSLTVSIAAFTALFIANIFRSWWD